MSRRVSLSLVLLLLASSLPATTATAVELTSGVLQGSPSDTFECTAINRGDVVQSVRITIFGVDGAPVSPPADRNLAPGAAATVTAAPLFAFGGAYCAVRAIESSPVLAGSFAVRRFGPWNATIEALPLLERGAELTQVRTYLAFDERITCAADGPGMAYITAYIFSGGQVAYQIPRSDGGASSWVRSAEGQESMAIPILPNRVIWLEPVNARVVLGLRAGSDTAINCEFQPVP